MKAYFHSLEPVVMPRADYIDEHTRLVKALTSGSPNAIKNELVEQRNDLGKALEGGRGRASGFIMRAMAENKLKHTGQYKNPTFPLAPGSKMNKPIEFDWRKLANKNQGGEKTVGSKTHWGNKGEYGASPFILHHFSSSPKKYEKGKAEGYPKETDVQRKARLVFTAHSMLKKAKGMTVGEPIREITMDSVIPVINHFGNAADLKAAIEPPRAEKEVTEAPPPKAETVVEKPAPKKPAKKVAESPTPPNPLPRVVWSPAEIESNPLTRGNVTEFNEMDEREQALFIFALNNPNAKLADAIKFLKEKDIGKGFSPSTISPLYKSAREDADKVLEKEEKQNKTLSNPAYMSIKEKLNSLLKTKGGRPLEALKNVLKGMNVDEYLDAFKEWAKATGDTMETKYYKQQMLVPVGKEWRLWNRIDYGKEWVHLPTKYNLGFSSPTSATVSAEIKIDGETTNAKVTVKDLVQDADKKIFANKIWYIDSGECIVTVGGKQYHYKPLYEHNMKIKIGHLMTQWMDENAGFNRGSRTESEYRAIIRRWKITYMSQIKNAIKFMNMPEGEMSLDGQEYIITNPKAKDAKNIAARYPKEAPENMEKPMKPSNEPPAIPSEWTMENTSSLLGKQSEGDDKNWFDYLSPTEKKVALWHLNNTLEYSHSSPEIPEGRAKASEIRKEVASLYYDFKKRRDDYERNAKDYKHSKAKSGGAYSLNKVSDADARNPEEVKFLTIRNKARYAKAKEALLNALSNYTVPPVASRAALLGKESGMMAGKNTGNIARGVAFGFGNNRKGYDYFVKNKNHPEVYKALVEFGESIVPKGWDFQTIQLNHNAKAKKHIDKNNVGKSVIIGIGDYNGGELRAFTPDSSKHHDYNIKDRPLMFNGAILPHETQPFSNPTVYERGKGRYTIVYFRHKYKPSSGNVGVGSGHTEDTKGMRQPTAEELEDLFV